MKPLVLNTHQNKKKTSKKNNPVPATHGPPLACCSCFFFSGGFWNCPKLQKKQREIVLVLSNFYELFTSFDRNHCPCLSVTSHGYHGLVCIVLLIFSWFGRLGTKLQVARNHGSLDLKIESGFSIAFEVCFQSKILIIPCIKLHHFVQSPYIRECSSYLKGIKVIFKKKGVQSSFK